MSCALVGCSAGGEGQAVAASASGVPPLATNAQAACARYFEWDLYRSTRMPGAQRASKNARREALTDFAELAARTASAVKSATIVGDLPKRSRAAANRIARLLSQLVSAGDDIADFSGLLDTQASRSAKKLEAQCAAAGVTLPDDNRDARG